MFNTVFDYLPFAAIIDEQILCIHAGVTKNIKTIDDISEIKLTISRFKESEIIEDLVWSDPTFDVQYDGIPNSSRGRSVFYSFFTVDQFLKRNSLKHIVKGHLTIDGVREFFKGLTSVNTVDRYPNRAGVVHYHSNNCSFTHQIFDHIEVTGRKCAFIYNAKNESDNSQSSAPASLLSFYQMKPMTSPTIIKITMIKNHRSKNQSFIRPLTKTRTFCKN